MSSIKLHKLAYPTSESADDACKFNYLADVDEFDFEKSTKEQIYELAFYSGVMTTIHRLSGKVTIKDETIK